MFISDSGLNDWRQNGVDSWTRVGPAWDRAGYYALRVGEDRVHWAPDQNRHAGHQGAYLNYILLGMHTQRPLLYITVLKSNLQSHSPVSLPALQVDHGCERTKTQKQDREQNAGKMLARDVPNPCLGGVPTETTGRTWIGWVGGPELGGCMAACWLDRLAPSPAGTQSRHSTKKEPPVRYRNIQQ